MKKPTRLSPWIFTLVLALALGAAGAVPAQEPAPSGEPAAAEPISAPPAQPPTAEPAPAPAAAEPMATAKPEGVTTTLAETPGAVADAVGGAASEAAEAAKAGGAGAMEQGRRLWGDVLAPMLQRMAAGIPVILKALLLLAVFWIAATLLGALVRKGLELTNIDDRAAKDLGLGDMLETAEGEPRSVAGMAGGVVKWVILAFGFLAFFDALKLGMVAGPLQDILRKITDLIPSLLQAALILMVYWIVATVVKLAVTKSLEAMGFDKRAEKYIAPREVKGEKIGPSSMVGRLLFYLVLLFGISPFLDALGQESLVTPLRDMMSEVLGFLPNILGALILLLIGKVVATIVKEVLTNFLAAAGVDNFARRFGIGKSEDSRQVSEIGGTVAFFFILIPILVAAVDALDIKAVSDPVKSTLQQLLSAIPLIFVAIVVIAIGYFIAKAVRGLVETFLSGIGFDTLPEKFGLEFLKPREGTPTLSAIGGTVVMAIILLLTAEQALATLNLGELSGMVGSLIAYLPNLLVGLVIILAALSLGAYVGRLVAQVLEGTDYANLVSLVARYAIVFLGFSMGLSQLGVGKDVVQVAVSAVLGGTALALGLAFGLGGRDRAKEIIERTRSGS